MALTPLAFTGISTYSADLQTILNRAVSIASIPIQQLQNQDADVLRQKTELASLSAAIASFATRLSSLGTLGERKALGATSSNTSVVTAVNSGADAAAVYTINEVTSLAKIASETSLVSYANSQTTPVSSTGLLNLSVDGQDFSLDISASNNLVSLRNAINAQNAGVTASILTTEAGNYLSISASGTGEKPIALRDDPQGANLNLVTATNPGADAAFKLNGVSIQRPSNTVNDIIPGLTFTLVGTTASAVTLTLATERAQISSALQSFVNDYNSLAAAVSAQVGPSAGLLSGDYIVREAQQRLREVAAFTATDGSILNLTDLGVQFDTTGKATFDSATFNALSDARIGDVLEYLSSATTGLGGLSARFTQLSDPVAGLIRLQQDSYDATDKRLQKEIATLTDRLTQMQLGLSAKLKAADTLLAQLEAQQKVLDASIKSVNLVTYGRNDEL